jgi:serine-type D-Ala-D-Ala carboxypeptidase/endopeptidase (penicillin-binding protein 4)
LKRLIIFVKNLTIMRLLFILTALTLVGLSCQTPQTAVQNAPVAHPIARLLDTSSVLSQSFAGLIIYDTEKKQTVFEQNAHRFFTPASNTKLYTLYGCLKTLGDSIPALRYVMQGDSLIFWGTGDPTTFHPNFETSRVLDFFKTHKTKKIYFSTDNFTNDAYGAGWQWDDYNDYYQAEISPFPMYGNIVKVTVKNGKTTVNPPFFADSFRLDTQSNINIIRTIHDNQFQMPMSLTSKADYEQDIPMKTSLSLTQKMLSDTLKRAVGLVKIPMPTNAKILYSIGADTVYLKMMVESDNMLAEHLLLLAGSGEKNIINSSQSINYIKTNFMKDLPDAPKWEDGSGLSRYNLFTPRTTLKLLQKIYLERPQDKLFSLLPTGGKGTLGNVYRSEKPFIFAKSGSLSGVYCLSGYLLTKQGKLFLFSFMNNNFTKPTSSVRKEVERILTWVHLNH